MRHYSSIPLILILLLASFVSGPLTGQNLNPSLPVSCRFPELLHKAELIKLQAPDFSVLLKEDKLYQAKGNPYRMGVSLPVVIDCAQDGIWQDIPGGKLWIIKIHSQGAMGLGLYFNKFRLPRGCTVHVFDSAARQVLGEFSYKSNPEGGLFASGITPGSELIIECFRPVNVPFPDIIINEVLYVYRSSGIPQVNSAKDFGGSEPCEVNINCPEGQAWQDAKHGVVRILVKIGGTSFWCTGSLVNNTRNDYTPYILTADHCAHNPAMKYASPADLAQWIFYFNFESDNCTDPLVQPQLFSSVGAIKMASATAASGSDFYLAMLKRDIPGNYLPFYNGWDRSGSANTGGVCIHHPQGDIKKISTYDTTLSSSQWGVTPGTHWKVYWHATASGNGVTERGSSGSPLFDQAGHILGMLTGGDSDCSQLLESDYFGKFAYSWESNGIHDSTRLSPWLDPDNTGVMDVRGIYDTNQIVADFSADNLVVSMGSYINFTDRTSGTHSSWKWSFKGAQPDVSEQQSPSGIFYSLPGTYDVQLIAGNENEFDADTILKKDYIRVIPVVYPIIADFTSENLVVPVGSYVNFIDHSPGNPSEWRWHFDGAEPESSEQQSPVGILYSTIGAFDVQMIASNQYDADTMLRKGYIHVTPAYYFNPNPSADGIINIHSWNDDATGKPVRIYNWLGKLVSETVWPKDAGNIFSVDLSLLGGSIFFISFSTSKSTITEKIIVFRSKQ
jgi:PKD repeat protein